MRNNEGNLVASSLRVLLLCLRSPLSLCYALDVVATTCTLFVNLSYPMEFSECRNVSKSVARFPIPHAL